MKHASSPVATRFLVAALAAALAFAFARPVGALAPTLSLGPSAGYPPSVDGTFAGSGWVCGTGYPPADPAYVTATGTGVSGSGLIGLTGDLVGSFSIDGSAGQVITVTVQSDDACPGIGPPVYLTATATFTFLTPTPVPTPTAPPTPAPTPVPTPTPGPSSTPTPASATPTTTPKESPSVTLPPLASPAPGQNTVIIVGCDPPLNEVAVEFVPLSLLSPGGVASLKPTGPTLTTPVSRTVVPSKFTFTPPAVEAGRIYEVSVDVTDEDCPPAAEGEPVLWLGGSGDAITLPVLPAADSKLEAEKNNQAVFSPEFPGTWVTDLDFQAKLQGQQRVFRWSTGIQAANGAKWQVSLLPFPQDYEADPFSPPGLVVSGDVTCTDCVFKAPLEKLQPPLKKSSGSSWLKDVGNAVLSVPKAAGNLVLDAGNALLGLVGLGSGGGDEGSVKVIDVTASSGAAADYLAKNMNTPVFLPVNYYVRVFPTKDGQVVGSPSNTVVMHWMGEGETIDIKLTNPTPTPVPTKYYDVKVIQYHGIIPPLKPDKICFITTADVWLVPASFPATYSTKNSGQGHIPAGSPICQPDPKDPSIFEIIGEWVVGAVNWVSETYADLKNAVISIVGSLIPDALCDNSCVGFALDATLASMGIPPSLPNFDQLVNMGLDYIAEQAVAQIGLPPEVLNQTGPYAGLALAEAEAKFKSEAEAQVKAGLKAGLKAMGESLAESVSWVPDGIPIRPDEYQQPGAVIKVTRPQGAPEPPACTVNVNGYVKIPAAALNNPDPLHKSYIDSLPHELSPLTSYDFFANESSQSYGVDKKLAIPKLAPGQTTYIPISFFPNYYNNGWTALGTVKTSLYINAWWLMHDLGDLHLSASGCGASDNITVPARSTTEIEAVP